MAITFDVGKKPAVEFELGSVRVIEVGDGSGTNDHTKLLSANNLPRCSPRTQQTPSASAPRSSNSAA